MTFHVVTGRQSEPVIHQHEGRGWAPTGHRIVRRGQRHARHGRHGGDGAVPGQMVGAGDVGGRVVGGRREVRAGARGGGGGSDGGGVGWSAVVW